MNYKELQDFIKVVAKSGISEVDIKTKEMKLWIKVPPKGKTNQKTETTYVQQIPVAQPVNPMSHMQVPQMVQQNQPIQNQPIQSSENKEPDNSKNITIKAPMVGTFYSKPSPDKPEFISKGDEISTGQVICIIEAMKLFNEIEAEVSGKMVKLLVEDGTPVEFDQPLFIVEPG